MALDVYYDKYVGKLTVSWWDGMSEITTEEYPLYECNGMLACVWHTLTPEGIEGKLCWFFADMKHAKACLGLLKDTTNIFYRRIDHKRVEAKHYVLELYMNGAKVGFDFAKLLLQMKDVYVTIDTNSIMIDPYETLKIAEDQVERLGLKDYYYTTKDAWSSHFFTEINEAASIENAPAFPHDMTMELPF